MLQLYYDFLDRYLDRANFQMCEMDTYSAYITITGNSVESLVKPELIAEFKQDNAIGFPAQIRLNVRRMTKEPPRSFQG